MTLGQVLAHRIAVQPMNAVATGIFFLAILHTFFAARLMKASHHLRDRVEAERGPGAHSFRVEVLHFLGEVEAVFGIWAVALFAAMAVAFGAAIGRRLRDGPRQLHGGRLRRGDHGGRVDPPGARDRRAGARRPCRPRARDAARLVARDAHRRAASRLVHHGAGGDDHLRARPRAPALRPRSEPAAPVRHARPPLRERVGRGDADALRRAPGPDGRRSVGLGPRLHGGALRLEGGRRNRRGHTGLRARLPEGVRGAEREGGARLRPRRRPKGARPRPGSRRSTWPSSPRSSGRRTRRPSSSEAS